MKALKPLTLLEENSTSVNVGFVMAAYEVELKFPLQRSPEEFIETLKAFGATEEGSVVQKDIYFSHPIRDFRDTDEALRIRSAGEKNFVTYKGPLLDDHTKTRQEIEISFADGEEPSQQFWAMLRALGFRDVRRVEKTRRIFRAQFESREFKIVLDDVVGLGLYVEVETLAKQNDWEEAREVVIRLAEQLALKNSDRRSYLQMLVEKDQAARKQDIA